MEREYNRNRTSYRPQRNDSRDDYQRGKNENYRKSVYGEKRVRRVSENHRDEGNEGKREWNPRERNAYTPNRERSTYREKKIFSNNREGNSWNRDQERQDNGQRSERKVILRHQQRDENGKRPRTFRRVTDNEERRTGRNREDKGRTYGRSAESYAGRRVISKDRKEELRQKHYSKKKILAHRLKNEDENAELRLNRYISMGGVCSRRDADELIVAGRVRVNGEVVETVGMKVHRKDKVEVDGVEIVPEKKVYLVLNKPKDYVTTVEDPLERKTVMSLVEEACKERIYPVGRLDRQTTGVLLFTNDGDLAKKLTHPKYDHKKIYHVFLDKALNETDLQAIATGIELEDGFIKADEINYTSPDRTEVGIEIHSGKNRIVRRIFEHFGYQIVKLDRVYFAGITKKNIPRGKWRFLTSREVNMLKVY